MRICNRFGVAFLTVIAAACAGCAPAPLCGADGIVHGGASLRSDSEIEAMSGCTSVTGDLSIGRMPAGAFGMPGETPTSLAPLATLTRVDGSVVIDASPTLTSLTGLEALTQIGGDLLVESLPESAGPPSAFTNLAGLSGLREVGGNLSVCMRGDVAGLSSLTTVSGVFAIGDESLFSSCAASVTRVEGFDALTSVGGLLVANSAVATIDLPALATVGTVPLDDFVFLLGGSVSGVRIEGNAALTHIGVTALQSIDGSVLLDDDPALVDVAAFAQVRSIGGDLIVGRTALQTLEPFGAVETIGGEVGIVDARDAGASPTNVITDLRGLASLHTIGALTITGATRIASLDGLEQLTTLPGGLALSDVPALVDLSALQGVTSARFIVIAATGVADLSGLRSLASIGQAGDVPSGPSGSLADVNGDLRIVDNAALNSLAGLATLTDVKGDLIIQGNLALPLCADTQLAQRLGVACDCSRNNTEDASSCQ